MNASFAAFATGLVLAASVASAAPPEPTGAHPRMLLDATLRAAWKAELAKKRGPVADAVALCDEDRSRRDHDGALYMGAEWAKMLQACLVAWAATDKPEYVASSLKFFTALIDDLDQIGDGKGGDTAASRDAGYPIRNLGPYTAIAYDWLHDAPGMTPALRARARRRWAAWLAWFKDEGYHARDPGANYQAGYLLAATLIAVAQGGEAADTSGPALWRFVADELWGKDMAAALAAGGVLDGGDWPEGWQYGPLSVVEYAFAARVAKAHGIPVEGVTPWLASLLRRHVHALTPADKMWPGGDFDDDQANMPPQILPLNAVALGDANPDDKRWAKGEIARLELTDKDWLLHDALATVGDPPAQVPRASWPTWYQAAGTATLFARSAWDGDAIWFVASCARSSADHHAPDAGNFALSRGGADLIVDPSPYGSLSTLTTNAPTVMSKNLGPKYVPSQAPWGQAIGWRWATKTRGGVVAARCDYADAYRFQQRESDIKEALRDFVLLPSADGRDASLVVVDRANTDAVDRKMYLRFRVPAELAIDRTGTGTATIGGARVTISGGHTPSVGRTSLKDCFKEGTTRGNCDAARFPVTDYRVEIGGPEPRAVHVIAATAAKGAASHTTISGDGWTGARIAGTRDAVVVWPRRPGSDFAYRAPKGKAVTHVVLDAPATDGKATISARPDGDGCAVTVAAGGTTRAQPAIVTLDDACAVTADPEEPNGVSAEGKPAAVRGRAGAASGGCCGGHGKRGGAMVAAGFVVLVLLWRRKKRTAA
jgi:hypothetical protein